MKSSIQSRTIILQIFHENNIKEGKQERKLKEKRKTEITELKNKNHQHHRSTSNALCRFCIVHIIHTKIKQMYRTILVKKYRWEDMSMRDISRVPDVYTDSNIH